MRLRGFTGPELAHIRCKACGYTTKPAAFAGPGKDMCGGCWDARHEGPSEYSKQRLKGLQQLEEIVHALDDEGILVGTAGLSIKENDDGRDT